MAGTILALRSSGALCLISLRSPFRADNPLGTAYDASAFASPDARATCRIHQTSSRILNRLLPEQRHSPFLDKSVDRTPMEAPARSDREPGRSHRAVSTPAAQAPDRSDSISLERWHERLPNRRPPRGRLISSETLTLLATTSHLLPRCSL